MNLSCLYPLASCIRDVVMSTAGLDIKEILSLLPHRYPFLLLDRVTRLEPGKSARGYKNVTVNEPFFQGHFPDQAIMPGALIIESMAQVGATGILSMPENQGKYAYLLGVDKAKFRKPVLPGDRLDISCHQKRFRKKIGSVDCTAKVNGEVAAEATLTFALMDSTSMNTAVTE